jgi:TRAP-type C4-dicarboxylate transport system permease small subunit
MASALLALERRTTAFAMWFACVMLVAAACLGLFQIFARFVLEQPSEWTEVLVRFTLIWMVFMGAPAAFRQGAMVAVDVVHRLAGRTGKRALDLVTAAGSLVLIGFMIRYGFDYAWRARVQTISGLESFSMTWAYLAVPIGALFCVLAVVACLIDPRRQELETAT